MKIRAEPSEPAYKTGAMRKTVAVKPQSIFASGEAYNDAFEDVCSLIANKSGAVRAGAQLDKNT